VILEGLESGEQRSKFFWLPPSSIKWRLDPSHSYYGAIQFLPFGCAEVILARSGAMGHLT
jgi:hypothetical protein